MHTLLGEPSSAGADGRPVSSRSAERPKRSLLNDKWLLGEELGRGAHGQARDAVVCGKRGLRRRAARHV